MSFFFLLLLLLLRVHATTEAKRPLWDCPLVYLVGWGLEGEEHGKAFMRDGRYMDARIDERREGAAALKEMQEAFSCFLKAVPVKTEEFSRDVDAWIARDCAKRGVECVVRTDFTAQSRVPVWQCDDSRPCEPPCKWQGVQYGCRWRWFFGYMTEGACVSRKCLKWDGERCFRIPGCL